MKIKRTSFANSPRAAVWVGDPWDAGGGHFADVVHVGDYPTHSPVLGPDGMPLEYEQRQRVGFVLRRDGS